MLELNKKQKRRKIKMGEKKRIVLQKEQNGSGTSRKSRKR